MSNYQANNTEFEQEFIERSVEVNRVAKVVKGGRRFAFRATVVVGDGSGRVGVGTGKARGVPDAISKASDRAKKDMRRMNLYNNTIPHAVIGRSGGAKVLLRPASPGTGLIAGGGVRAVLQAVGVQDILTKSLGSANILNVVKATMDALDQLKSVKEQAKMLGKSTENLLPFWERNNG
ncbi:MAG: 30S ribosomal protein S5 [Anaerolineales bacterium]|nr:30S ribosomal protein S5 [Anaerolineales bacterium]